MSSSTVSYALTWMAIFVLVSETASLKCYRTNKQTKEVEIVESEEFKFCSIFPTLDHSSHLISSPISDSLTAEELDKPFEKMFEENDSVYKMLSVCLYEKYDWPKVFNPKFHSQKTPEVELVLRCVCGYDLCNSPSSFSTYINDLDN